MISSDRIALIGRIEIVCSFPLGLLGLAVGGGGCLACVVNALIIWAVALLYLIAGLRCLRTSGDSSQNRRNMANFWACLAAIPVGWTAGQISMAVLDR